MRELKMNTLNIKNSLTVDKLSSGYEKKPVIKGLSFQLKQGEILGVIGSNGAGKTTLLKTIMGIIPYDQGSIFMGESDLKEDPFVAKKNIAYIPEVPILYGEMTLREHMEFTAMAHEITEEQYESRSAYLLKKFRMEGKLEHFPNTFSKGMRQKVMVMNALLYDPRIYIVDEPFIGLDPKAIEDFLRLIEEKRRKGASILMSTHVLDTAEKICDRFLLLDEGEILAYGSLEDIREKASLHGSSLREIYHRLSGSSFEDLEGWDE